MGYRKELQEFRIKVIIRILPPLLLLVFASIRKDYDVIIQGETGRHSVYNVSAYDLPTIM